MKSAVPAVLLAVAALVPAGAAAKGSVAGQVCSASGCAQIAKPLAVYQTLRWSETFALRPRPRPAPFYTLTFYAPGPDGFSWSAVYAPARRALLVDDRDATPPELGAAGRPYWRTVHGRPARLLASLTRGLDPFPPSPRWTPPR